MKCLSNVPGRTAAEWRSRHRRLSGPHEHRRIRCKAEHGQGGGCVATCHGSFYGADAAPSRSSVVNIRAMPARWVLVAAITWVAASALAQGGPPLMTDDPATVEKGTWELNIAWVNHTLHGRSENELLHYDASHGISDRAHFKIEVPWLFVTEGGRTLSGDAGGSTGLKWRFIESKGSRPAVSTYPQIGFSLAPRSVRLGLSEGGTSLLMPLQVQWDFNDVSVNADSGLVFQASAPTGWIGGVAVGRKLPSIELLAEIHGEGVLSTGEANWIGQLGLRHDFDESSTLIIAFGRTLAANGSDRFLWTSYAGVQLHF